MQGLLLLSLSETSIIGGKTHKVYLGSVILYKNTFSRGQKVYQSNRYPNFGTSILILTILLLLK